MAVVVIVLCPSGFQVNAVRIQQTCTAMPEIVETYQFQVILCQDDPKVLADVSWFYSVSYLISENIFQIIFVISVTT